MNIINTLVRYTDKIGNRVTLVGFGLGILYWVTKSVIYAHTLKGGIIDHLFHLDADDLLIRLIVVLTFTLFGYVVETMVVSRRCEELLQTNEQLRQERAKLEAVMQQMPSAVVISEAPSGRIILGNKQAEEIWRQPVLSSANVEEYGKWKGFHLEDGRPYRGEEWPLGRSLLHGEVVIDEKAGIIRGDGTRSVISIRSTPIRNREGEIEAAVVIFNDIAAHIEAEETRSRLTAIVESAEDAIICKALDQDGTIISWNRGAERIYGYSAKEAIGRSISLIFPPERLPDELSKILKQLRRGESIRNYETLRLRKDEKRIAVSITISPLRDTSGRIFGAAAIERDITEQKRAVEELQRYRFHLEELVQERTHELMTTNSQLQSAIIKYKQTQDALEKSLNQNKLILDSVGEGIYGVDLVHVAIITRPVVLGLVEQIGAGTFLSYKSSVLV
ncbi:MAG: PAS domain S-box protein [bacterium]